MMLRCPLCGSGQYEKLKFNDGEIKFDLTPEVKLLLDIIESKVFSCTRCTTLFLNVKKFYSGGRHGAPVYGSRHENKDEGLPEYHKKG